MAAPFDVADDVIEDDDPDTWARNLEILLVHDGVVPNDRLPDDFQIVPGAWSPFPKPLPFPLSLESTWYLAACLVILLAVHLELDTSWLLGRGYFQWAGRIISGVSITVAIAVLSMVLYDVLGTTVSFFKRWIWGLALNAMTQYWRTWDGNRPWYLPDELFHFVASGAQILYDLGLIISLVILKTLALRFFGWATVYGEGISTALSDEFLIASWAKTATTLAPELYGKSIFKALIWEVLPQLILQIGTASFLYFVVLWGEVKTMEPVIFGARRRDSAYTIFYNLVRAIALHILSNTAYQMSTLCILIFAIIHSQHWPNMYIPLESYWPRGLISGVGTTYFGSIAGAAVLYGAHVLVAFSCWFLTLAAWPFWRPYIAWLTLFVEPHIEAAWPEYRQTMEQDTQLVHRRYYLRALMTLLFGSWSSWPMRHN